MKKPKNWFRSNVVYGLVVLVPMAILFVLVAKLVEILEMIARGLNLDSALSAGAAVVIALLFLLLVCFALGAAVRTKIGTLTFEKMESTLLQRIPGYDLIGSILKGFAKDQAAYPAVMVSLHGPGSAVFGLLMEENANGSLTVFLPSAPALTVGSVHVVARDRVTFLEAGAVDVVNCISQWGVGSEIALGDFRP